MQLTGIYSQAGGVPPGPPSLVSVEILADGLTLRATFDQTLTSGSPSVGFSATGTVLDVALGYSGNTLDFQIPSVAPGAPAITFTITGDATAGNVNGSVTPVGPVAVTNSSAFTNTWVAVGNSTSYPGGTSASARFGAANPNDTDLVISDDNSDSVLMVRYTSPNWAGVGTPYSIPSLLSNGVVWLSGNEYAVWSGVSGNTRLIALTHNGSSFSLVGNDYPIAWNAGGWTSLERLADNLFLAVESSVNDVMQVYSWDGTDFAPVGIPYSIGGRNGHVRIGAVKIGLNASVWRIALVDSSSGNLDLYEFDGTNIIQVPGSTLNVASLLGIAVTYPSVTALASTDFVVGSEEGKIQTVRWDDNLASWSNLGASYTVSNPSAAGSDDLQYMGGNEVAFMRPSTSNSFLRRLRWQ